MGDGLFLPSNNWLPSHSRSPRCAKQDFYVGLVTHKTRLCTSLSKVWSSNSLLQGFNGVWQGQRVRVWWILEEGWWIEERAGDNPVTVGAREHTGMLTSVVSLHPLLPSLCFCFCMDLHPSLTSLPSATMGLLELTAYSTTRSMSWANWFVRWVFMLHREYLCEGLK